MRILIAIGVPRQKEAGAAGVVLNHARELEKLGHSVECWFLDDIFEKPVRYKRFEALAFSWGVAKRIGKDPTKFDVVNIHAPWGCIYGLQKKAFSSRRRLPPYVLTMQGSEERFVEAMKKEHKKGRAVNFGLRNRAWHRFYHQKMYDMAIRNADGGAVANREAWVLAELKYKHDSGVIWYVPNGTEESFFTKRQYSKQDAVRLLYVGTWIDRKGIFYLAEAFCRVATKRKSLRLTIAGCSVSEEEVKNNFPEENRSQVNVIPFISREKMPTLYAEHEIFVFPSLVEGMPLTLLEAMAGGMPVVTTNSSGMADVVEDEFNGLLVQAADSEKLADAIDRLVESVELRERIGQAAQATAERYTWKGIARNMERILLAASQNEKRKHG